MLRTWRSSPELRLFGFVFLLQIAVFALLSLYCAVRAQELGDHNLRGPHPMAGQYDPYARTVNVSDGNCCHGTDCARFYGGPNPVHRAGKLTGYQFGKWFVRLNQLIDVDTLPIEERGFHHLCIGVTPSDRGMDPDETVRCGHVATGA